MSSWRRMLTLTLTPVLALLLVALAGDNASSTNDHIDGAAGAAYSSCATMPDCAASADCAQHCSGLIQEDLFDLRAGGPFAIRVAPISFPPVAISSTDRPPPRVI